MKKTSGKQKDRRIKQHTSKHGDTGNMSNQLAGVMSE